MMETSIVSKNKKPRVLIIDDDQQQRKQGEYFFGKFSDVFCAPDTKKGKEILAENDIDIVLSDIMLNGESGIDFAKWVKNQNLSIFLCLMTSEVNLFYQELLNLGVQCFEKGKGFREIAASVSYLWMLEKNLKQEFRFKREKIESRIPFHQLVEVTNRAEIEGLEAIDIRLKRDSILRYVMAVVYRHPSHPMQIDIGLPVMVGCFGKCIKCQIEKVVDGVVPLWTSEMAAIFYHCLSSYRAHGYLNGAYDICVNTTTGGDFIYNSQPVYRLIQLLSGIEQLRLKFIVTTTGNVQIFKEFLPKFAEYNVTIYLSVQSFFEQTWWQLQPGMKGQKFEDLAQELYQYFLMTGRRVTISYLIIPGVNDSDCDIEKIVEVCERWEFFDIKFMNITGCSKEEEEAGIELSYRVDAALKRAGLVSSSRHRKNVGSEQNDRGLNRFSCGSHIPVHYFVIKPANTNFNLLMGGKNA